MKNILLCPPTKFDIEYEINPWMHLENKADRTLVMESYSLLKATLMKLGASLYEINQAEGLPDMVYTANFGFVSGNRFIAANYMFRERRGESKLAAEYFDREFGFTPVFLPETVYFEGQGDLLTDGERYFFGWGKRSHREAKGYLEEHLGHELIDFELVDPFYYHLDTCFAPLSPDVVVINPRSFTEEGKEKIYKIFPSVIETSEADNMFLACNLVCLGKEIVVGKGITDEFKRDLYAYGYTTHEIPMGEYLKGGGSVKCCSFEF